MKRFAFAPKLVLSLSKGLVRHQKKLLLSTLSLFVMGQACAQLSSNPDKFLGNITTAYNVDYGNEKYYTLWNQITCENESKWASIEGNNNSFNWSGSDKAYNYAKSHNFPFKFHALVWGSQYPSWIEKLTPAQRYQEIVSWMDAVKKHYPDLQMIDVVNEAVAGHQQGTTYFIDALGGKGVTGYDWIIKAFELAYERWPNAILIYNDFNTFQWNTDQYIDLVKTLRNAGAPIDAYGCQSHDLTDCSLTNFKSAMIKLQNALKMPMYSTEYDIGTDNDSQQKQRYSEQIPYMWESEYCAGITLWGYIYGQTWTTNGNSGIIKNGADRPAMTWLREYMKTDAAKNAKSPFPGMKKEASVYIKPASLKVEKNVTTTIFVRAKMRTKTIDKVKLYAKGSLIATLSEAPYEVKYTPTSLGDVELKAVVTTTDGNTYTRYGMINVCNPRTPFRNTPTAVPGVLQAEDFDMGIDGIAFHDTNTSKEGTGSSYRTDATGIDIDKGGSGYVISHAEAGEWMEYTLDVKEAGVYSCGICYSALLDKPTINISLNKAGKLLPLTPERLVLPKTGDWNTYKCYNTRLSMPLEAGKQIIRISILDGTDNYIINLDKIDFKKIDINEALTVSLANAPATTMLGIPTPITPEVTADTQIDSVRYYVDGFHAYTATEAPFTYVFNPTEKRSFDITAEATDANGKLSNLASLSIQVLPMHAPFKEMSIPGIIEAEDFDRGEEGLSFHDSDDIDQGKAGYRTDNEGVDIIKTTDGYAIGYTVTDEWLEYTVDVTSTGKYTCKAYVACTPDGGWITIGDMNGTKMTSLWNITLPKVSTNTKNEYKEYIAKTERELTAGTHVIRIVAKVGGYDLDRIEIVPVQDSGIHPSSLNPQPSTIYDASGKNVGKITHPGIYIVKTPQGTFKVIK